MTYRGCSSRGFAVNLSCKMPHCVAFGCNKQTKYRKTPSVSFHAFPKDERFRQAWVRAIGRTSLPKNPRLCSEHFEAGCYEDRVRLEGELLGSCPWKRKLKPDALLTTFSHKKSRAYSSYQQKTSREKTTRGLYPKLKTTLLKYEDFIFVTSSFLLQIFDFLKQIFVLWFEIIAGKCS